MRQTRCTAFAGAFIAGALILPGPWPAISSAMPSATEIVNAVAVDTSGRPTNGYREVRSSDDPNFVAVVSGCEPSPAAVSNDIYYCSPGAAAADVCWPSTQRTLLCLGDVWDKELHRVSPDDALPQVQPTSMPEPFALLLDDGSRCRLRNGGAWGGRDDGLVGAYGCLDGAPTVLGPADPKPGTSVIDRSQPQWTVRVGDLGSGDAHLPPPQIRRVVTAWFAATG